MKVILTGSSGRIGSAIARFLRDKVEVVGVDNRPGPFTTFLIDIRDKEKVFQCLHEVDAVIHCAALLTPHVGLCSDNEFWEVNVKGTENLIGACVKHSVKRFVFTSTTSVYGDALIHPKRAVWVTEELLPNPRDIYDETKIAAENLCIEASNNGLSCISLRMSRCFPEREDLMAIYRLYRGVHEEDVALAHELALNLPLQGYEMFNISCKPPFHQTDIEELKENADQVILRYFPWAKKEFIKRGWALPKTLDRVYVIDKAIKLLGYRPTNNFSEWFDKKFIK
ncbi:MAG TPA: NAD(P)-dependent oxidoreductase [Chlamydiales bacterium]|nr:NAD(P)-dependent oxidoreductase [Chlamydiales bacterium]